jgi:hypothetical protein
MEKTMAALAMVIILMSKRPILRHVLSASNAFWPASSSLVTGRFSPGFSCKSRDQSYKFWIYKYNAGVKVGYSVLDTQKEIFLLWKQTRLFSTGISDTVPRRFFGTDR